MIKFNFNNGGLKFRRRASERLSVMPLSCAILSFRFISFVLCNCIVEILRCPLIVAPAALAGYFFFRVSNQPKKGFPEPVGLGWPRCYELHDERHPKVNYQ
jgi:hypothetical protein